MKYRPCIVIAAWAPWESDEWFDKAQASVPDPDGDLDMPEFVIIGPTRKLMRKVKVETRALRVFIFVFIRTLISFWHLACTFQVFIRTSFSPNASTLPAD